MLDHLTQQNIGQIWNLPLRISNKEYTGINLQQKTYYSACFLE